MTEARDDRMSPLGDKDEALPEPVNPYEQARVQRIDDGTGLFRVKHETKLDVGNDGDDVGRKHTDQGIADMLDSGHGFLVREVGKPKTVGRVTCEVCDGPLPTPGNDPDWLCQYYDETRPASLLCNCSWCRSYQDYLAGRYKPRGGRPRQRCGAKECDRQAAKLRKRKQRGAVEAAAEPVRQLPVARQHRARQWTPRTHSGWDGYEPPPWNRPRRRNEPNWWLHCQRKRAQAGCVTKTT
jgi:hypothetical protein